MTRDGRGANWIALAPKKGRDILKHQTDQAEYLVQFVSAVVSLHRTDLDMHGGSSLPLTSKAGLEVEEADLTVAAVPSGHVTEAVAASCLRVALVHLPRRSSRTATAG